MNYEGLLKIAENKFNGQFDDVLDEIRMRIASGSTGSEIISSVGKYVKDLEFALPQAYSLVENEIQCYLKDCKKIGLTIL